MTSEYRGFFIKIELICVAAISTWDAQALISSTDGGPVIPNLATQTIGHRDSRAAETEAFRLGKKAIDVELEINSYMGGE